MIFQIQSLTGHGQFLVEELNISECQFEQSKGSLGGAFHIIAQKNTVINILNSSFYNLSTTFFTNNGGAFYLDGTSSLSLIVGIIKVKVENIFAQHNGGFLYLKSQSSQISINIKEINLSNVYAKNGSFAYLKFSFFSKSQIEVQINNILFNNNKKVFIDYLNQQKSLSRLEVSSLLNNRFLFYIDSAAKVISQNFKIENLILESAFIINNSIYKHIGFLIVQQTQHHHLSKLCHIHQIAFYNQIKLKKILQLLCSILKSIMQE
ncbi:unnamed protein product [Paramecium sonneborni]|uniref:Uncharacterized protein n=1 Tax=Paramecium sonneborni TaxID=65129 RepID=A0A8S1N4P0_9CILI|nr:unnamed protein product [Paramecium sonneborni]